MLIPTAVNHICTLRKADSSSSVACATVPADAVLLSGELAEVSEDFTDGLCGSVRIDTTASPIFIQPASSATYRMLLSSFGDELHCNILSRIEGIIYSC